MHATSAAAAGHPTHTTNVTLGASLIANAAFCSALFPFVSPLPASGRDVQLFALAVAAVACIAAIAARRTSVFFDKPSCMLLAAGWIFLMYVRWDAQHLNGFWLQRTGAMLLCLPVYWAARAWYDALDYRVVVFAVAAYLVVGVLQLLSPAVVNSVLTSILGGLRFSQDAGRGATSLAPEPSGLAAVIALCLWLPRLIPQSAARVPRYLVVVTTAACAGLILLSGSLMGVVLVLAMGVLDLFDIMRKTTLRRALKPALLSMAILAVFLVYASRSSSDHRALTVVRAALHEPAVLVRDPSLQARLLGTVLSVHTLTQQPLGTRQVDVNQDLAARGFSGPLLGWLDSDPALVSWLQDFVQVYGFTELGRGVQRLGLLYFGVLAVLLWQLRGFLAPQVWLLAVLTQNSLYMSPIWLLLGLCVERRRRDTLQPRPR